MASLPNRTLILRDDSWVVPPERTGLRPGQVHLWRGDLDLDDETHAAMHELLEPDEAHRASRFVLPLHQRRFTAGRAILRLILSRYLCTPPERIRFEYGAHGKPRLAASPGAPDLRFNLSHSVGVALYAVSLGRELGIDVEEIRCDVKVDSLAERNFAVGEVSELRRLDGARRREAFFHCWARKEAYVKGTGDGLLFPLDRFEVSVRPDLPARLLTNLEDPLEVRRWELHEVPVGGPFAAALAVQQACAP